ncbi:MAG TPA: sigma 54-interacting transcriptional regulator [Gemmatimonadaceae bacterium]|nr:sigma 54-interacting transcriptional regulator [Gemmatimonadaceae bacterium]
MQSRERSSASARDSMALPGLTTASQLIPQFPKPRSEVFNTVLRNIGRYARDESITILFEGESGTGKNWLARWAHQLSKRSAHELHEISAATMNDPLVGSELFGHLLGAFTDARALRPGAFQSANHSTLFLDELGKATPQVQRFLLRAIEERVIRPVGSDRTIKVDVRLLLATNVSLKSLVAQGLFLPDLYARLGNFCIHLPPLRERREDIPDLARFFLAQRALYYGYPPGLPTIQPALLNALQEAQWEFNLRGLDSAMHRLIVAADSAAELTFEHCVGELEYLRARSRGRPTKASPARVVAAVKSTKSVTAAARELSVSRSTIYRNIAKQNADIPSLPVADLPRAE